MDGGFEIESISYRVEYNSCNLESQGGAHILSVTLVITSSFDQTVVRWMAIRKHVRVVGRSSLPSIQGKILSYCSLLLCFWLFNVAFCSSRFSLGDFVFLVTCMEFVVRNFYCLSLSMVAKKYILICESWIVSVVKSIKLTLFLMLKIDDGELWLTSYQE